MDELRDRVERVVRQVVLETLSSLGPGVTAGLPAAVPAGRRPLLVANWKMHHTAEGAREFARALAIAPECPVEVVVCPPAVLLPVLRAALPPGSPVLLGGQNLHPEQKGAFTGEHSAAMLLDAGARYVIVGHSERRALFGEDDAVVGRKIRSALDQGLRPILCVGETLAQRRDGGTFRVLRTQLDLALSGLPLPAPGPATVVVAYEPVWAIGTGQNATPAQAQEAMAFLRDRLAERFSHAYARQVRLLYGGSASPDNVEALSVLPDVDGFLVGGASLDAGKFSAMLAALQRGKGTKG